MVTEIRNCDFKFQCDRQWDALDKTKDPNVRYCNKCEDEVYFIRSNEELRDAIVDNHCVALVTGISDILMGTVRIKNDTPKFFAFCPKGILAPSALISVMVPEGEVNINVWLDAMSARVQLMLSKKLFKNRAAKKACKALRLPPCENLDKFGEHIVKSESGMINWINASVIGDDPFSAYVTEDDTDALLALESNDLEIWVGNAQFVASGVLLSDRLRFHPN